MRAVWWTKVGPPEVLVPGEAPDPEPGTGQVLVGVAFAGITFIETQMRAGRSPKPGLKPPAILGNAVGGTVLAVGPDTDVGLVGQQVVTSTGGSGGYAELAVASAADVLPVPDGVSLADATALLADGRTALGLHRHVAPRAGQTVLVEAAGGGVGSLLVQLAVAAGARVIAAASGPRWPTHDPAAPAKLELARGLGASATIDYRAPDWGDELAKLAPDGLDIAYDGVGGAIGGTVFAAMAPGGRFVVHGVASGAMTDTSAAAERGLTVIGFQQLMVIAQQARELSGAALAQAAAGTLRPVVGQTFPLVRAADAHATIEARQALGKTLLVVG